MNLKGSTRSEHVVFTPEFKGRPTWTNNGSYQTTTQRDGSHYLKLTVEVKTTQTTIEKGGWIIGNAQGEQADVFRCGWKPEPTCKTYYSKQKVDSTYDRNVASVVAPGLWKTNKAILRNNKMLLQATRLFE